MLPLGVKVFHSGHGHGEVVDHNQEKDNKYSMDNLAEVVWNTPAGIISALATSFYSRDLFPNVIKFEDGHKDVYADNEVSVIN